MAVGWPVRSELVWDQPGQATQGRDARRTLDQIEYLSQGVPVGAVYKSAGTSINSGSGGSTYQNDPHLSFEVEPSEVVRVTLEANWNAGAGAFKQRFLIPSGDFQTVSYVFSNNALAAVFATLADGSTTCEITGGPTGSLVSLRVMATLFVGATGGTVNWQWAQNASNAANTTVSKGGVLKFERMA